MTDEPELPGAAHHPAGLWRRIRVPLLLLALTCLSAWWVGTAGWRPMDLLNRGAYEGMLAVRQAILAHWDRGLYYMLGVVGIVFLHEMGHFVAIVRYRVRSSFPYFIPFPFSPIGTMGAVIAMHGQSANRREIFDIGIAGPLAGLVLTLPVAFFGASRLDLAPVAAGDIGFRCPLLLDWMIRWLGVPGYDGQAIWLTQLNPALAAGWFGFVITGLNMMPVGQLDGGHVTYTLFGRGAHAVADAVIVLAVAGMVWSRSYALALMVALLLLVGTHHPPTVDDRVGLGWWRWSLGLASLAIPVLCFPPLVFSIRT